MPGPWQHYIPGLARRHFGIKRSSGKPTHIWRYTRARHAEEVCIKGTGAEDYFYSSADDPADDNLDATIEKYETKLADRVGPLRKLLPGTPVDASLAAEVVAHLSMRTLHVRQVIHRGASSVADRIVGLFATDSAVKRQLGLDRGMPAEHFATALRSALKDIRATYTIDPSIPDALLENVLFQFARENEERLSGLSDAVQRALSGLIPELGSIVRNAHNTALAKMFSNVGPAWTFLCTLSWRVEAAPSAGAILPDCVAVGISETGVARPLLLVDRDDLAAVLLPLSSRRLLVGRRDRNAHISPEGFNRHAASCSYDYFEAATSTDTLHELTDLIGTGSAVIADKLGDEATRESAEEISAGSLQTEGGEPMDTSYQLVIEGCPESAAANAVARVAAIVDAVSRSLPLGRLDGITFASDYVDAVRRVDRGDARLSPERATAEGVGRVIVVFRDGTAKGRIVMRASVAYSLLENPSEDKKWAAYLLTYELVQVSMIEFFDRAFPGVMGQPHDDQHEGWLFEHAHSALDAFVAARFSAPVGDPTVLMEAYRVLLEQSMHSAGCAVQAAKATYHETQEMAGLAPIVLAACRSVLESAAKLLGTADALGSPALLPGSALEQALQLAGLQRWLVVYLNDLRMFHNQLGRWPSISDLLRFNRHVDRVMWALGVASWRMPDGSSWFRLLG